jgi:hypothetical protein
MTPAAPSGEDRWKRRLRLLLSAEVSKFALVIAAAVAVGWFASTSERMLRYALREGLAWNREDLVLLGAALALWGVLWQIWRHSRRHAGLIVRSSGEAGARSNLAVFLSPPYKGQPAAGEIGALLEALRQTRLNLCEAGWCPGWLGESPWRMPLEAVAHHARLAKAAGRQLKRVYVISSPRTRDYFGVFRDLVEGGLGQQELVVAAGTVNFEKFEEVSEAVNYVFKDLEARRDKDLLIDLTGGSKICSVVAAALCFEQGRRVQYVHGQQNYQVMEYDLGYLGPEFLKPGA